MRPGHTPVLTPEQPRLTTEPFTCARCAHSSIALLTTENVLSMFSDAFAARTSDTLSAAGYVGGHTIHACRGGGAHANVRIA
jgi:hypothetical protein